MASRKRSSGITTSHSAQMKYRPSQDVTRGTAKGTKPLAEPASIGEILTKLIVYGCKKYLFVAPKYRLVAYAILLFFVAQVADSLPFPKTYFAYSSNILNQAFVKFSWAWTLSLLGIFMFLTSSVYCAGERKIMLRHFSRLLIATLVWFTWTNLFSILETTFGQCKIKSADTGNKEETLRSLRGRRACSAKNGVWTSFDISGHAFLLIWCVMVITEEAKAILGWDAIKDFIRHEDYNRNLPSAAGTSGPPAEPFSETPLNRLSPEEFEKVKKSYRSFGLYANISLVLLTALSILWDIMLIATAVYFHNMIEKLLAGLIAAIMWYIFYECVYTWDIPISPGLPGIGLFKYSLDRAASAPYYLSATKPRGRDPDVPQFMGMRLNA